MALSQEEVQLIKGVQNDAREVRKALEQLETRPAFGRERNAMFGFQDQKQWSSDDWHKYAHLGQAYSAGSYDMLMGRQKRLSGVGPCLVKMAAIGGNKHALQYANQMPDWSSSYDDNKLEEQYGCTTIVKAREVGIPRFDFRTNKVLLNERRKTSLAENSGQAGGYTLAPQFQNTLLTIAAEQAFIEQRCTKLPMNGRTADWPMLDLTTNQGTGVTPYYGGMQFQWQAEAVTYNQTQPAFRQSTWTAWDLVGLVAASNQLLADNGIGLDALLTQLISGAITWYKEYAFLQGLGAGSSMPLGVLNAPATIQQARTTPGKFKLADAAAMMSRAHIKSWDTATWVMHQSVIPELIQMVDNSSSNRLVWVTPMGSQTEGPAAMKMPKAFLNGLPIYFTEKVPKLGTAGDVSLIDWSYYVVGNRMDIQIDVNSSVLFTSNQMMWRVILRCDGKPWLNNSITDAAGWNLSPFVTLGDAA